MPQELKDWVRDMKKMGSDKGGYNHTTGTFLRDPLRSSRISSQHMLSPADGVILYQKEVAPNEKIVEVKGKNYDLKTLLMDDTFDQKSLVVGIFMTYLDVHVNRCPYGGYLSYEEKGNILTNNLPMVFFEDDILKGMVSYNNAEYLFANSRVVNHFRVPLLDWDYYLVQIADKEVNVTMHFEMDQDEFIAQGDRFSIVRWGSQVELVLPLSKHFKWKPMIKNLMHVSAGQDVLLKLDY